MTCFWYTKYHKNIHLFYIYRFHSGHVASKYRAQHDQKRSCILAVAVVLLVLFNHVVIFSDRDHQIHRVRHRCMSMIFLHLKHAVHNRLDQPDITSWLERLLVYVVHGAGVEDAYFHQTVGHIWGTHRTYTFCFCILILLECLDRIQMICDFAIGCSAVVCAHTYLFIISINTQFT